MTFGGFRDLVRAEEKGLQDIVQELIPGDPNARGVLEAITQAFQSIRFHSDLLETSVMQGTRTDVKLLGVLSTQERLSSLSGVISNEKTEVEPPKQIILPDEDYEEDLGIEPSGEVAVSTFPPKKVSTPKEPPQTDGEAQKNLDQLKSVLTDAESAFYKMTLLDGLTADPGSESAQIFGALEVATSKLKGLLGRPARSFKAPPAPDKTTPTPEPAK